MLNWLTLFYKTVGADYPRLSLIGAVLIGGMIFGVSWWAIGKEYRTQNPAVIIPLPTDQLTKLQIEDLEQRRREERLNSLATKLQRTIVSNMTSQMGLVSESQMKTYLANDNVAEEEFDQIIAKLQASGFLKVQPGLKKDGPWYFIR